MNEMPVWLLCTDEFVANSETCRTISNLSFDIVGQYSVYDEFYTQKGNKYNPQQVGIFCVILIIVLEEFIFFIKTFTASISQRLTLMFRGHHFTLYEAIYN